jgi:hypothetical protein
MKRQKALLGLLGVLVLTGMDCAETKNVKPPADASDDATFDASACGECGGATPYCDAVNETCVACLEAAQCGSAEASRCEAGACVECEGDNDCDHIDGKARCAAGECVACTTTTEEEDCGPKACNPVTKACGTIDRGSQGNCEPCEADSECGVSGDAVLRCVPLEFQDAPHGSYCLIDKATATGMMCPRKFPSSLLADSVNGTAATYCSPVASLTTCEALVGFKDTCTTDADCGAEGLADGLCRDDGAGLKCTYKCSASDDCSEGINCSTDAPAYCCTDTGGLGCD